MTGDVRFIEAGDTLVLLEFDDRIDARVNARAVATAAALAADQIRGVLDVVPTFRSVAVYFNPVEVDYKTLVARMAVAARDAGEGDLPARDPIRIPVCYGGDFGPDLSDVAAFAHASPDDVTALHAAGSYRVFMLGFLPGFAYMGTVDPTIAAPRRSVPRTKVPRGSVAIAGQQTGIYPSTTPGGWQIIGRTPLKPFDATRDEPCLFRSGDTVEFYAIERRTFDTWDELRQATS